jgi:hypothetical protein
MWATAFLLDAMCVLAIFLAASAVTWAFLSAGSLLFGLVGDWLNWGLSASGIFLVLVLLVAMIAFGCYLPSLIKRLIAQM